MSEMPEDWEMTTEEFMELQRQGAEAAARGGSPLDNPWYRSEKMPAATGMKTAAWNGRVESWGLGFTLESAMNPHLTPVSK